MRSWDLQCERALQHEFFYTALPHELSVWTPLVQALLAAAFSYKIFSMSSLTCALSHELSVVFWREVFGGALCEGLRHALFHIRSSTWAFWHALSGICACLAYLPELSCASPVRALVWKGSLALLRRFSISLLCAPRELVS